MSILPLLFSYDNYDPWEMQRHHKRSRDDWDHFGLGITPREIQLLANLPNSILNAGQRQRTDPTQREPKIQVGKDGFQVLMDVQQFRPNEVSVKAVDNTVIIEGKHEEREDEHGHISRQFIRKYTLPKGYDIKEVVSTLSSDGVLTIKAPPPQAAIAGNERVIQIQQTGPAHLNVKDVEHDAKDNVEKGQKQKQKH